MKAVSEGGQPTSEDNKNRYLRETMKNLAKLQRIVDGRDVRAHGNTEMPVWGDAFRRSEGLTEQAVAARIAAIVRYLESIQERAGH